MTDFHEWQPGEGVSAQMLNEHLRAPMMRVRTRRKHIKNMCMVSGTYYSAAAASNPYNLAAYGYEVSIITDGRPLILMATLPVTTNGIDRVIYYDFWVKELGIWVSTGTASQAGTWWLGGTKNSVAAYYNTTGIFLPWVPPITQEQPLTFQLVLGVSADSWYLREDLGYTMIGVMEA